MASVITPCLAIVVNLAWAQVSMVSQECPPDIVIEKVAPAPVITPRIIPAVKPEKPRCRKGQKIWRTLKDGRRKYRIRRTC